MANWTNDWRELLKKNLVLNKYRGRDKEDFMEQAWRFANERCGLIVAGFLISVLLVGCKNDTVSSSTAKNGTNGTNGKDQTASGQTEQKTDSSQPVDHAAPKNLDTESSRPPASSPQQSSSSPSSPPTAATAAPAATAQEKSPANKPEREPVCKDWPQPKFVLVMTGQQMGYIEPCGCTGLENQKGGLARRHTLVRQLSQRGWPVVAVDAGNQIHRFGRQSEIKFQITVDALKKIGYQAVAFGGDDLRLSAGELAAVTLASDGGTSPFVCANAAVIDRALTPTHQIVQSGGKKIGITAILGSEFQSKIVGSDIILTSPEAGLDAVMPELKAAKCDLLVLLAHTSESESTKLAEKYRDFQVVVAAPQQSEPRYQPETIGESKSLFIKVGEKGMYVGILGFFDDPKVPWRYEKVELDSRFEDSSEMLGVLASYQEQLKTLGLDGLGIKPIVHPSGNEFVGSEKCGECHTKAFEKWKDTPHAHATESLVHPPERSEIARHFDPECLSCHVTGWHPKNYFPYKTGYLSLDKSPQLVGSGCENCHGPGSAHVAAESGAGDPSDATLAKLRQAMRLRLSEAEAKCMECHDIDNSPSFHAAGAFQKYWKKVEHTGLD